MGEAQAAPRGSCCCNQPWEMQVFKRKLSSKLSWTLKIIKEGTVWKKMMFWNEHHRFIVIVLDELKQTKCVHKNYFWLCTEILKALRRLKFVLHVETHFECKVWEFDRKIEGPHFERVWEAGETCREKVKTWEIKGGAWQSTDGMKKVTWKLQKTLIAVYIKTKRLFFFKLIECHAFMYSSETEGR